MSISYLIKTENDWKRWPEVEIVTRKGNFRAIEYKSLCLSSMIMASIQHYSTRPTRGSPTSVWVTSLNCFVLSKDKILLSYYRLWTQSISGSSDVSLARRRWWATNSLTPVANDGPASDIRHCSRVNIQLSTARWWSWDAGGRNLPHCVIVFRGGISTSTLSSVVASLWGHFLWRCLPADDRSAAVTPRTQTKVRVYVSVLK